MRHILADEDGLSMNRRLVSRIAILDALLKPDTRRNIVKKMEVKYQASTGLRVR
jgi:hypothetical protein